MDTEVHSEESRRTLAALLGPALLFAETERELCAHVVARLDVPRPIDVRDIKELEAECRRLLSELERPFLDTRDTHVTEVFRTFLREVMSFAELPIERKRQLEREVKADIATLDILLSKYRTEKVVQAHLAGERPRDHRANALVTFHDRCVEQKEELERFLASDLEAEALTQCTTKHHEMLKWMPLVFGPRLPLSHPRVLARFDYWSIDQCGHRVRALPVGEASELKTLYRSEKHGEFYERLKQRIPPASIFLFASKVSAQHPELAPRSPVMKELEALWSEERWLAFHALALPQVEGLIGDMLRVAGISAGSGALPDKVRKVVPLKPVDESAFDYFQWLVPFTRNSFSHNGLELEPERRAHDDLYDLMFLFEVFANLETPLIRLRKLFDVHDLKESFKFPTVLTTFFQLIDELPEGHDTEVAGWRKRVLAEADLAAVVAAVDRAAREATDSFCRQFQEIAGVNLVALPKKELWRRRAELAAAVMRYRDVYFQSDRVDQINAIQDFVRGFRSHLSGAQPRLLASLKGMADEHVECWSRLRTLQASSD